MGIALTLKGHEKDLGDGFFVRRFLPDARRQSVGPFVFFDHFGPVTVQPDSAHDVRPHPHIGLATVTYLFDGAITHRDNLGCTQVIEPGAINWMTAGRGIVHSERRPEALRGRSYVNHGLQLWAALPLAHEEAEPAFVHTPAAAIPTVQEGAARVRVLIGSAFGASSPVATFAPTVYLDVQMTAAGNFQLPALAPELAVYPVEGNIAIDGENLPARTLSVLSDGGGARIESRGSARLMVLGGAPLDGPRYIGWNFVSSRKERILQAAADWQAMRAEAGMAQVPGETEFIPLPERRLIG
ncbi:MAG: pirin family protein [Burkholderiaceae bacterium]|nr:pirin family protein [Burkholderiaceae bacterium]MDZ4143219.1 pirin family protein [Burkholderiales bacterium]